MSDDLHAIIADQAETIDQLRVELDEQGTPVTLTTEDPYWQGVYDRIRAAWDAWALAELGTSSPSQLDLEGRRELAELWEAIR